MSILISGSNGVLGKYIKDYYKDKYNIIDLDINIDPYIDCTDEKQVQKFIEDLNIDNLKYIINCIGIPDAVPLKTETLLDIDIDYFKKMIDINLNAVFIIIKECYRKYKDTLKHIINISSMYSVISPRLDLYNGKIKNPAYTASKHGLIGLTKHLATILGKDNIKINCIGPGGVEESINDEEFKKKYNKNVPLNTTINLKEITTSIDYLINMNQITGQNIIIDGGYSII